MEFLPLGPCYFDGNSAPLVASVYKFHTCLLAHGEYGVFRRSDFPAIDTEKDVPRFNASDRCCSSCVDILKDPTFSIRCFVFKVGCAECGPARRSTGTAVKEAQMGGVQFRQQIAHGLLKCVRGVCALDQRPVPLHCGLPIASQLFRRIEPLSQSGKDVFEDCVPVTQ